MKEQGQKPEPEILKTFKKFTYYYFSPVVIAAGLALAGSSAVYEGKRIVEGEFNTVPNQLKDATGHDLVPSYFVDAMNGIGIVLGGTAMASGVALRRASRGAFD